MVEAVEKAGVPNMVWYNYRRIPAVTLAKQLIDEGKLGKIFHYRAKFLQDWTIKADLPQGGQGLWRLDVAAAGSGVTGDLLAHCIDTAIWLNGRIDERQRHDRDVRQGAEAQPDGQGREGRHRRRLHLPVPVRQRLAGELRDRTRYARGHKALYTFEINGENASIIWDLHDLHRLQCSTTGRGQDPRLASRSTSPKRRPPVHGQVVGAGPGDRLRAQLRAPGGRLPRGAGDGQAGQARLPRRLRDAAGARRDPGVGEEPEVGGSGRRGDTTAVASLVVSLASALADGGGQIAASRWPAPGRRQGDSMCSFPWRRTPMCGGRPAEGDTPPA